MVVVLVAGLVGVVVAVASSVGVVVVVVAGSVVSDSACWQVVMQVIVDRVDVDVCELLN